MITRRDSWRWELDPRDPDYEPSPDRLAECDEEMPPELEADDDDPRNNGPMHYQSIRGDL